MSSHDVSRPHHKTCGAAGTLSVLVVVLTGISASAQQGGTGSFLIAPTRLVFEGRTRSAELTLSNTGTTPMTYRLGLTFYTMTENGDMREVKEPSPEDWTAHGLLRYSPRQVTLEPGVSQTVRVAVRKPADLPTGEYRSHLVFRPVPSQAPAGRANDDAVGVTVQMHVGVSIAVIVRQGETSATASLDVPALEPGQGAAPPALSVTIRRSGNQSLYGMLVATFQPSGGRPVEIGLARGVGVYVPIALRHFRLVLKVPAGTNLGSGRVEVRLVDEQKGKRVLATTTLVLP